jgi:hypothetical protein
MNKAFEMYRGKLKIKSIMGSVGFGFIMAVGMLASVLARAKEITHFEIMVVFVSFWVFLSLLFITISIFGIIGKKVVIFNDGIQLKDRKNNKRMKIAWDSIEKVRFEEEVFGAGVFVLSTDDVDVEAIIPFPLKKINRFVESLDALLGKEHVLARELRKRT